jgi:hypothetical protein
MAKTTRRDVSAPSVKFTADRLEAFAKDLKSQRVPLERQQISDDRVVGLRAMIHKTGLIAFHVSYYVGDKRPFMKIGDFNKESPDYISIEDAREVAKTIKALGEKGIDVQDGLQRRLVRELKEKGTNWRVPK